MSLRSAPAAHHSPGWESQGHLRAQKDRKKLVAHTGVWVLSRATCPRSLEGFFLSSLGKKFREGFSEYSSVFRGVFDMLLHPRKFIERIGILR